ncbi:MAG TPA: lipoprotein [Steroidobacteraceae bacterium]|nr:lipoprotein [Steroidobacteraceae bacterium]
MKRTLQLAGIALLTLLASGCGQRGALYLPDQQRNVVVKPAQDSDVPQASPIPQASPAPPATPVQNAAPAPADASTTAPAGAATSTDTDPPRRSNATQRN